MMPVRLPLGRRKSLSDNPSAAGFPNAATTIGIVEVALLAASALTLALANDVGVELNQLLRHLWQFVVRGRNSGDYVENAPFDVHLADSQNKSWCSATQNSNLLVCDVCLRRHVRQ
jgi:hypothetical protein